LGLAMPFRGAPAVAIALYAAMRLTFPRSLIARPSDPAGIADADRSPRLATDWTRTPTEP
jgi:hypothetical protein